MTDPNGPNGLVGQIIADRYRIDKKLGGGGMGEVYLGEHVRIQRKCAVKVLRAALSDDQDSKKRFENEARNASQINHPNVAQVYDFGEHEGLYYLVMEFIEGQSMQDVLERDDVMHPDVVADAIMQAASALEAAHAQHVLHRDVKPDNIMLAKNTDGTYLVKLVDFGIARATQGPRMTQTGMVVGTPEYMSPEQISGEPLDNRSDLYSLALVAFQALTGAGAYPDTGSMESLILRLTSRPRTLIQVRSTVNWPPKLQNVFDKALESQRENRHNSVVEFATDLSDAIVTMSPSETQAFYRRALEARSINPVALTPSATPAKPSKEKKRGKTDATKVEPAPPPADAPRYMGPPPRETKLQPYAGPGVKRTSPWRLMLFLAGAITLTAYLDDNGVVAAKFNSWGVPAVTTAFNQIRVWTKKDSLRPAGAVTPPESTTTPAKAKPRVPKAATPVKKDSTKPAATQATPPKTDSSTGTAATGTGTVPPPPAR